MNKVNKVNKNIMALIENLISINKNIFRYKGFWV